MALAGTLLALGLSACAVAALRFINPPTTAFMVARALEAKRAGRDDFSVEHHWVALSSLPSHVPLAVLCAEDQRFFRHAGFDFRALRYALADHLKGAPLRGASTLTQQVAKNLFLWEGRSFVRKALEGYFTLLIEQTWPKQRILEIYLNVAEFGDGVFGVAAASRHHFARPAHRLSPEQAAALAAILPAPRTRNPRRPSASVKRKQRWILQQMRHTPIARHVQH